MFLLLGCQHNDGTLSVSWGDNHKNISIGDISEIIIEKVDGTGEITTQQDISSFMNAINNAEYDNAQLDIAPSDYSAEIILERGETKKLSLWLTEGLGIFVDQDENGHYKLLDENDKSKLIDIINKVNVSDS